MKTLKNHFGFIVFFSITIAIFLYPLITMHAAFLGGDSFSQFFPWLKIYSKAIKSLSFPYWTRCMGNGFPLMAEGQVGGFYPLNILFFFILPFKVAYNYSVIFHFIMGGIFTYLYTRRLGADQTGGSLAALLFCFGSAYAGCFCNIMTLRVLTWFPLILLLVEHYFDNQGLRHLLFIGALLGLQFLAGAVQMAAYSAFFCLAYFVYKALLHRIGLMRSLGAVSIFSFMAVIIALPQIMLTYQLAQFSYRESATLGFSLWGSFSPLNLLGIVFPYSFSFRSSLYVGILSILFVTVCFCSLKEDRALRPVTLIFALSIFLALGAYNPVYVVLLKMTKLYIFRNPSKFLFFAAFSLSVLAGIGLTKFFDRKNPANKKQAASIFFAVLSISGFLFLAIKSLLLFFKGNIINLGDYYVKAFVFNKPYHRYSLEHYLAKCRLIYDGIISGFSFSNIFVILSWCIFIAALLFCLLLLPRKRSRHIAILLIFIDIFVFSFYGKGFSENIKAFAYLIPDNPRILERLKTDPETCRILPFDIKSGKLPNWSLPNANITYDIDSAAYYTPLASQAYRNKLNGLEAVDDSLGLKDAEEGAIKGNMDMMRLLNIKYIIAQKELREGLIEKVDAENGIFLYRLRGYFPRLFFSYDISQEVKPVFLRDFKVITYRDGFIEAEMTTDRDGFIVFSENYYPGWRVFVDGKERKVIKVKDILQGVAIGKGYHNVIFTYKPQPFLFKR